MALSGNLDFVTIDEVLRLLIRAEQQASVEVRGDRAHGRIFVVKRGISLATTHDDASLRRHLLNSGYVDSAFLDGLESGRTSLAAHAEAGSELIDLLREMAVETLFVLSESGGSFEVTPGAVSPYASPKPFELEPLLDGAHRRVAEWEEIHKLVPDLDEQLTMHRDLGDREEITLDIDAWRLLCELGTGSSVHEISDRLGTTDFWTARVVAGLVDRGLLDLATTGRVAEEPVVETVPATPEEEAMAESAAVSDPDMSWWREPEEHAEEQEPAAEAGDEEPDEARLPKPEREGEVPQPEEAELFLEKVFSQLEPQGETQPEDEGYGLLRRRRLGSVLKDLNEDPD